MYCYPRLRDLREDHDLTQADVAKLLKTTQQQYFKYEKGIQEIPVHHLIKLSKYYNVTIDFITAKAIIKY
ncbi:MAG: helix-turn-helix domain-containing protein [[Clostridium] innocuum]|uniref:helix-turn-helix domain-containing protein n=1 Tax=Clostridium sp. TaxID=1506 RepID=UPI0039932D32